MELREVSVQCSQVYVDTEIWASLGAGILSMVLKTPPSGATPSMQHTCKRPRLGFQAPAHTPSPLPSKETILFSTLCSNLPQPGHTEHSTRAVASAEGRDGAKQGLPWFHPSLSHNTAWFMGREPPQLPASHHPTLLPTWAPVGRKGASDTWAGSTGSTCFAGVEVLHFNRLAARLR